MVFVARCHSWELARVLRRPEYRREKGFYEYCRTFNVKARKDTTSS